MDPARPDSRYPSQRRSELRRAFDRIAPGYDRHAALEQEVGRRLLQRCEFVRREPARILDLGCGTGAAAEALKRRYRRAEVIGVDLAPVMLAGLKRRSGFLRPLRAVCGDIAALPFARSCADLLFANLVEPWAPDRSAVYDEYRRVLRPGGLLLFSTLGPGSLAELRRAAEAAGTTLGLPDFPDLMAVGDALVAAGFSDPVMDMERITLQYRKAGDLARELEGTGSALLAGGWGDWTSDAAAMAAALETIAVDGRYPLGFEIIYGTAFGPEEGQPRRTREGDVATFSVDSLLKSRRIS